MALQTTIRIWVKDREANQQARSPDTVHTGDVDAKDLYATLRELEVKFAPPRYAYRTRTLNPLGL